MVRDGSISASKFRVTFKVTKDSTTERSYDVITAGGYEKAIAMAAQALLFEASGRYRDVTVEDLGETEVSGATDASASTLVDLDLR